MEGCVKNATIVSIDSSYLLQRFISNSNRVKIVCSSYGDILMAKKKR